MGYILTVVAVFIVTMWTFKLAYDVGDATPPPYPPQPRPPLLPRERRFERICAALWVTVTATALYLALKALT